MEQIGMEQIGVVGLGIMGAGIVEVFASSGLVLVGVAESAAAVEQGKQNLAKSLERAVQKGKRTESEAEEIKNRVTWSEDFSALANCDLVVEAAPEILALKKEIFGKLDDIVKPTAILASNTSSLSVTEIASSTKRPEQVLGFHFFNPAPVQKFVELITTEFTDDQAISDALQLGRTVGKYVAQVGDRPGFIVNRLLLVYLNHAVQILDSGIATREDIDSAMRELAKFPMGPLELIDLIGIDTCVEVLKTIYTDTSDDLHKPAQGLVELLAAGHKGRKSGKGFYSYEQRNDPPTSDNADIKNVVFSELETAYLGDAVAMAATGYASQEDVDSGMKLGCGLPVGPFERIAVLGMDKLREQQAALAKSTGQDSYAPLPL